MPPEEVLSIILVHNGSNKTKKCVFEAAIFIESILSTCDNSQVAFSQKSNVFLHICERVTSSDKTR